MPLTEKETLQMQTLLQGQKYVDHEFPLSKYCLRGKCYKRPHELVDKPQLFVNGTSDMDVEQGGLGDCWFLSVAAVVARYPQLIRQVIPEDQSLTGREYTGLLAFRFWNLGQWTTVYIDDTLPVDEKGNLLCGQCTRKNEFWLPLLEKAFAKFHGGYENLNNGFMCEALLSLTGHLVQDFHNANFDSASTLYRLLSTGTRHDSLIAAAVLQDDWEKRRNQGIANGHAYSVTGTYTVRVGDTFVQLVRLRNPWGSTEWSGPLCDKDPKWTGVDKEIRSKLNFVRDDDGQFFMKVSHFKRYFTLFWVATPLADFGDCFITPSRQMYVFSNCWDQWETTGGSNLQNPEEFIKNPQYILTVEPNCQQLCDNDERKPANCDVVIQLIQDQHRGKYKRLHNIGIIVFQLGGRFPKRFTADNLEEFEPHNDSVAPVQRSSVIAKLNLQSGKYIVVPSAKETAVSRNFMLRVYSRKPIQFEEVKRF